VISAGGFASAVIGDIATIRAKNNVLRFFIASLQDCVEDFDGQSDNVCVYSTIFTAAHVSLADSPAVQTVVWFREFLCSALNAAFR
jgi:hypothetical protein